MVKAWLCIGVLFVGFKTEAQKVYGEIILEYDVLSVMFDIPKGHDLDELDYTRIQNKVRYVDITGRKKILKPEDAVEFRFEHNGEEVRMVSVSNVTSSLSTSVFMKLEIDGTLKLYRYYDATFRTSNTFVDQPGGIGSKEFIQKGNGNLISVDALSFKEKISDYLSDCTELVEKLEEKDLKKKDISFIVKYYNIYCR